MTLLHFPLPGRIYRSSMPFGSYDSDGVVLQEYTENQISVIVPLASIEECEEKAHMNLHELYREKGFDVVPLPVEDYSVPSVEALSYVVNKVIEYARSGRNVVVHCSAGRGRTGTFMACLARRLFGFSGMTRYSGPGGTFPERLKPNCRKTWSGSTSLNNQFTDARKFNPGFPHP